MRITRTRGLVGVGVIAATFALASCSTPTPEATTGTDLTIGAIDLAAAGCPADIRIATDWFPEAEHGHLYNLIGDDYTIETASEFSVTGPLMASGEYTGVDVTIISGGAASSAFLQPDAMMYSDDTIFAGYVGSDEAVVHSGEFPTVGVFAPLEKDPQMIMWDPETLPDITSIADLGAAGTPIKLFAGGFYIDYFLSEGILQESQLDYSYDGSPAGFVAAAGTVAQQGFASAEPYIYENEITDWGKAVDYELINDAGYPKYAAVVSVKPGTLDTYADCLTALVPVLQQAEVDYYADPATANATILDAVATYDTFWVYSQGVADFSVDTQVEIGLVGNGTDDIVGNVDMDRVQSLVDIATGIYADDSTKNITEGITAEDIFTDKFIDSSIGF
jgi:hypothetical protein